MPPPPSSSLDRHDLYERCVQDAEGLVPVLRAIHGGAATRLGEDFCGTGLLSRTWVRRVPGGRALAVDADAECLERARASHVETRHGDVVDATDPSRDVVDVLHAGNFSIGEWHERGALLRYLRHARARLASGGVLVCDLYGGESAMLLGSVEREHVLDDGTRVVYEWEQRAADPFTGRVIDAIHFRVESPDGAPVELRDAFVYDWRLWSVPELRDAMHEAGFPSTEVHARVPEAIDADGTALVRPLEADDLEDDSFDVLVVGRA